jgi:hypothetical protein
MIRYFFEELQKKQLTENNDGNFRLYVILGEQYYWNIEWTRNKSQQTVTLPVFNSGFLSEETRKQYGSFTEITPEILREHFGSFANFIERAVEGFRSYLTWISPDPQLETIPWQLSTQ